MTDSRRLLQHFAPAYRTQKALRDAPYSFADFRICRPRARRSSCSGT